MMEVDLEELERLAKAACLPWHIHKENQLDDQHEEIHNADGWYVKNVCGEKDAYILAICNAGPELIKMYREADDKANNAWRILLELQARMVEMQKSVRELERQREFFLKTLNDNRLCPNGGCFHDGSDLDEWDCTSYDNRECWIQAAKEAGE